MSGGGRLGLGERAPAFRLPDTAGTYHGLPDPGASAATVVVWTCNHCPYALAWHDRILDVARDYADRGVRFLQINSNDAERYPNDSREAMRERFEREDWPTPYLHDAEQTVAADYGARTTPDVFVLGPDLHLAYRGAPDADHGRPELNAAWLRGALDAVLAGDEPDPAQTEPVGCSIKWRSDPA